jgi:exopolysaccharide biosynthesis polyprenyl glycosylphosphotransferase
MAIGAVAFDNDFSPWLPRDTSTQAAREKGALGARVRHSVSRGAVVAGGDLLALAVVAVVVIPNLAQGWVLAFALGTVALCGLRGAYRTRITMSVARDVGAVVTSVAVPLVFLGVVLGLGAQERSLIEVGIGAACAILFVRACVYGAVRSVRKRGAFGERTLIVGAGQVAVHFAATLDEHPEYGLRPVGFLDDVDGEELSHPLLGRVEHLDAVLSEHRIDRVVLAFGISRETALVDVLRACDNAVIDIHVLPRFFELGFGAQGKDVDVVWGYPLLRLRRDAMRLFPRIAKRLFDLCFAGLMLIVGAPLYGALALAVKVTSPGPVYFRQSRVGKRGKFVEVLKFRSMRVNNDSDTQWDVSVDDRVTPIGNFMRKSSLDELPQLWNVVKGDMSLVGPRPERPYFVERFQQVVPHYQDRHRVPAGLTGLAQVNGLRGDTSIHERAWFDNHYIDNWSMSHDLVILARTAGAVIKQVRHSECMLKSGQRVGKVGILKPVAAIGCIEVEVDGKTRPVRGQPRGHSVDEVGVVAQPATSAISTSVNTPFGDGEGFVVLGRE